jgi:hypothetical protein
MFDVLLKVAAAMRAGLAVTVAPHHLDLVHSGGRGPPSNLPHHASPTPGKRRDSLRKAQSPSRGTTRRPAGVSQAAA